MLAKSSTRTTRTRSTLTTSTKKRLQKKNSEEYGEEQGSGEEGETEAKEPPVLPEFNEEETLEKFDDENAEIEIPDEVIDDVYNDWVLSEDEEAQLVNDYWASKESG